MPLYRSLVSWGVFLNAGRRSLSGEAGTPEGFLPLRSKLHRLAFKTHSKQMTFYQTIPDFSRCNYGITR